MTRHGINKTPYTLYAGKSSGDGCLIGLRVVSRSVARFAGACGTGASEKNTHPAAAAGSLSKPPSPRSQGWVSSSSGSGVAKKTPISANQCLVCLPTLRFGGGRGGPWARRLVHGWVFFSLAPGSDFGIVLCLLRLYWARRDVHG